MAPVISVIIPVYNVDPYLPQCLESIKNQSFGSFECILIDDGSTDRSGDICDEYVRSDNRFKVFHIENNGRSNARNYGIENSCGDYIAFVDSDDFIDLNTFEKSINRIQEDDLDICCFGMIKVSGNDVIDRVNLRDRGLNKNFIKNDVYMNSVCNKLFRRSVIIDNSIRFALDLSVCEDLLFTFKAMSFCKNIGYLDDCLYSYRIFDYSRNQASYSESGLTDLKKSNEYLIEFCGEKGLSDKFRSFLKYRELYFAISYLIKPEYYSPKLYRANRSKFNYWTYTFRPDLFVITFFSAIHFDLFAYIYKKMKQRVYEK